MRRIKQVRFYSDSSDKNYPSTIERGSLISGTAFQDYSPILQLGIQALPGSKFYVNNSSDPIIIGSTGIYELDLAGETEISNLQFDGSSLLNINDTSNAVLIVDLIYEDGEEA